MRLSLLFLALLLTACAPASPLAAPTDMPVRITPIPSATQGTSDGVPLLPLATETPGQISPETPDLAVDPDGKGSVITGTFCCGYTTPEFTVNYLPEFQIRADGAYTWVQYNADGSREVLHTVLTAEKVSAILEKIAAAGFFGWADRYSNDLVADYADKCIRIELDSVSKSVCEYYEGAPEAFHELFAFLQSGAGETGAPYMPESAFVRLALFDVDFVSPTLSLEDSPDMLASIPAEGGWIMGEPLTLLWDAVNRAPWGPTVGADGTFYIFTLQIENLSPSAPPSPPDN